MYKVVQHPTSCNLGEPTDPVRVALLSYAARSRISSISHTHSRHLATPRGVVRGYANTPISSRTGLQKVVMAEAVAIVGLINACIGLTKEIINIGQAAKDAHGLPENLAHLFEQLPPLQHLFEKAKENNEKLDPTLRNNARPVLKQCEEAFRQLEALFKDLCPEDGANPAKRIWKGASAAISGKNTKLQMLWKQIEGYLNTLEKQEIFIIGDTLSGLEDAVELLAKEGEGLKFTHHGSGNQNVTEKGGTSFNMGGGDNNNYTSHNQGARYEAGGDMHFGGPVTSKD